MIEKICIDWGNTLCPITGEYSGPMIEWPVIELFDGVLEALHQLEGEYELYIATNAKESTLDQIKAVMVRVECDELFTHIFTPAELGVGKEDVNYYRNIAKELNCSPDKVLMIGDDYSLDVRNAWEAGFQTCLFNPTMGIAHEMYLPLHQYEIASWDEFMLQFPIPRPTIRESVSWLQRENESYVLLQHTQTVAAIAYWFAERLRKNGLKVDAILAHRAGYLHDLDKLSPGRPAGEHGSAGAAMLREMGYPAVADIVGSHVIGTPDQVKLNSIEAEIVFFADKLVKHNQIVSVQERFIDLGKRYPQNQSFCDSILPFLDEMQAKLCKRIGITPEEMLPQIKSDLMGQKPN